jgi:hypothetical protein
MTQSLDVGSLFLDRCREYLITEYRTKLRCSLEALPSDIVWWRPNESSNSVGNLVLHLIGNVRQWVISGIGGVPDTRHRAAEFLTRQELTAAELVAELERVLVEADSVLNTVRPDHLLERRIIQGRDVTILEAVLGVVQHFSQHVGQVIWIAKQHAPRSINFVEDARLARPLWRDLVRPSQV